MANCPDTVQVMALSAAALSGLAGNYTKGTVFNGCASMLGLGLGRWTTQAKRAFPFFLFLAILSILALLPMFLFRRGDMERFLFSHIAVIILLVSFIIIFPLLIDFGPKGIKKTLMSAPPLQFLAEVLHS